MQSGYCRQHITNSSNLENLKKEKRYCLRQIALRKALRQNMRNSIWGWKKARVVKVRLREWRGYMAGTEAEE